MLTATSGRDLPLGVGRSDGRGRVRAVSTGISGLVLAGLLLLLVLLRYELTELPLTSLCNVASLGTLAVLAAVFSVSPRGIWSVSVAYLAVFCLFHFGLTLVYGLGQPVVDPAAPYIIDWFFGPAGKRAILLACAGSIACGLGAHAGLVLGSTPRKRERPAAGAAYCFDLVGFLLMLLSAGGWFVILARTGGLGLLGASYGAFLDATEGQPIPWIDYGVGLGVVFLAAAEPSRLRRLGFALFILWSVCAFPLGLRGEVLFPAIGGLAVMAKKVRLLSAGKTALLVVSLLSLIALVKDLRQTGLQQYSSAAVSANPLGALTEMGGSLRPVVEAVTWIDKGDRYINGASYWAPFDRAFAHVFPGWPRPPADEDDRLMNVLVGRRVGEIGFSPVAEAYYNGGLFGVVLVMLLTGLLLGAMDRWPATPVYQVTLGIILVELLMQTRNDFTPVPFHIANGLLVAYLASLIRPSSRAAGRSPMPVGARG